MGDLQYGPPTSIQGWSPTFAVLDTSGGAPAGGGSGYALGDLINLSNGVVLSVTALSGSTITGFLVSQRGSATSVPANPVSQVSTSGSGSGASFNLFWAPVSSQIAFAPAGIASNGAMMLGQNAGVGMKNIALGPTVYGFSAGGSGENTGEGLGGGSGMTGAENTLIGYNVGTQITTGNWITAIGHHAAGHEVNGVQCVYIGTDAGKYALNNFQIVAVGVNALKNIQNSTDVVVNGSQSLTGSQLNPSVTGAANNGSGLIRLALSTTSGMTTGDAVFVGGVGGVPNANTTGTPWVITVIDGTHIDLQGSTFAGSYTTGGVVLDMPAGFINVAVLNAINNGSGLIRLEVATSFNMVTGDSVIVSGVGGVAAANGIWTITVIDNDTGLWSGSGARIDLQGSTFSGSYTSGGHVTDLKGPSAISLTGYDILGNLSVTGGLKGITAIGNGALGAATAGSALTIIGSSVGATNLGQGYSTDIILIGTDSTTDVAANNTGIYHAIGIGQGVKLRANSVLIGSGAAAAGPNSGSTFVGYQTGTKVTGGSNTIIGSQVGSTTLTTGGNNVLIGTTNNIDTASGSTSNTIQIGAGSTAVISATGCGTPSTSIATMAGSLVVNSATGGITVGSSGPTLTSGSGAPSATQPVGSLYLNTGGSSGSRLYVSAGGGSWNAVAGV